MSGEPSSPATVTDWLPRALPEGTDLTALGGARVPGDPAATDRLVAWLEAQLPPVVPDEVQVTDDGVLVAFRYVSDPDAVVTAATR